MRSPITSRLRPGRSARRAGAVVASLVSLALTATIAGCSAAASDPSQSEPAQTELVRVPADAPTITEAVERVAPGGMVLIAPGVYEEQVLVDRPDITIRGEDRNETIIDGEGLRPYGIVAIADGVRVQNLTVREATFYGVLFTGMHDDSGPTAHGGDGYTRLDPEKFPPLQRFEVSHVTATNNGLYGIYAFDAQHGVIADSYASGSADSGFYVGQCEQCDILVTRNVAERNAIGFEDANASDSLVVVGNRFTDNRVGLTLISNYQEAFTPQRGAVVAGNVISGNTSAESPAHAEGAFGIGVGISGGTENTVTRNRIEQNAQAGLLLANTEDLPARDNRITGNAFAGNGVDIGNVSAARTPATGNCFEQAGATAAPAELLIGCIAGAAQAAATRDGLPAVSVPPGMSFLDVPGPRPQPSMSDVETIPSRLPDAVELPSIDAISVPPADLLAEHAGVG